MTTCYCRRARRRKLRAQAEPRRTHQICAGSWGLGGPRAGGCGGALLPALIFAIVVTQILFLSSRWHYSTLSWNLVRPGSREFVGRRTISMSSGTARSGRWRSTRSSSSHRADLGGARAILALLLDRAIFLGRGVVRTLLITPFLVTGVAS